MDLVRRVQNFLEGAGLLPADRPLVVGVSGGPDSLCLLDALTSISRSRRLPLHVAHLDHGLRPGGPAESEWVRVRAQALGWPFDAQTVDTRAWAAAHRRSIEEAGRDLRYAFLAQVADRVDAQAVAVAHTADDQAETVLMHFLRGSGLAGLRGMLPDGPLPAPATTRRLVRPLLDVTRAEVEAYCALHALAPLQDPTNQDTTFFRNRLRHVLLPELERYNPNVRAVLGRTAAVAAGEHELVEAAAAAAWARAWAESGPAEVVFDRAAWLALSVPEQRALLRRAARRLLPEERNLDFTPIDRAVQFSRRASPGRSCDLLRGLRLAVTAAQIRVSAWGAEPPRPDQPWLDDSGRLAAGWTFTAEEGAESPGPGAPQDRWSVVVAADSVAGPDGWSLRRRRPGDRFRPLGMAGHSIKVADFLINEKVEARLRAGWPLVTAGGEIVWVAGLRLAEPYRVTPKTGRRVRLSFTPTSR